MDLAKAAPSFLRFLLLLEEQVDCLAADFWPPSDDSMYAYRRRRRENVVKTTGLSSESVIMILALCKVPYIRKRRGGAPMGKSPWFYATITVSVVAIFALIVAFGALYIYAASALNDPAISPIDKELQSAVENAQVTCDRSWSNAER